MYDNRLFWRGKKGKKKNGKQAIAHLMHLFKKKALFTGLVSTPRVPPSFAVARRRRSQQARCTRSLDQLDPMVHQRRVRTSSCKIFHRSADRASGFSGGALEKQMTIVRAYRTQSREYLPLKKLPSFAFSTNSKLNSPWTFKRITRGPHHGL